MKKLAGNNAVGILLLLFLSAFPLLASDFRLEMMGKFIVLIIFAIAMDLVWGYAGLLSLGHAVFFGIGGYVLALSYSIQNGVPGFMTRFDINEIPAFLQPLESIPVALLLGLLLPSLLAGIIGSFIFKSKVSGVYFALITLALGKLFEMLVINLQMYTGGFNGLMGLPRFPVFGEPMSLVSYYYMVLIVTVAVYLFAQWLTNSHFGKVLKAVRENEARISFFSYNVSNFKILIFVISGFLSGLAGMLYVPINGFFSPSEIGLQMSTLVIVWLAIGGRGTLMGAAAGALIINWLSNLLSERYPELWQLLLGAIIVLVVLFFPDGIYGTLKNRLGAKWGSFPNRKARAEASNTRDAKEASLIENVRDV
ncbi:MULTISPECIES: urea ABC transporter permease subunit UrtC [unclassified Paenibacillus]|uniref:urea ABC transporter permease subunit UrtC n=1 Tax=unclassified Paenibacillus TaxID=185978 RepID=UPI0024065331|nr:MULTISPECIES: urea ABC transporter permease subunit UrtC [unclassified Paenibacillus]MDF9839779.1 urea transport system permease protein [Paenibacillus sp. PastF-2]MDF9846359.1 urea transport system permease protein [Paenibacillus sp. PastM-2]MDF9853291.1 urea transport system permease protein [Paenibacillus sp. PastF-1]MDH6478205.1 urea transport system permease protein [Paenibacillus sp. PastH-2]MDH6506296.1 urea transport system permease protein [Paenibacillus sp. PastM-3]